MTALVQQTLLLAKFKGHSCAGAFGPGRAPWGVAAHALREPVLRRPPRAGPLGSPHHVASSRSSVPASHVPSKHVQS